MAPAHWEAVRGGAQYQIDCLLKALIPLQQFEIYYLARRIKEGWQPSGYRVVRIGKKSSVPRLGYWVDARSLSRTLRELRPQVIYQRVGCGYTGICAYYARHHQARLIWHVAHDSDVMPDTYLEDDGFVRRRLEKLSIEYGIRNAHDIVVQSEHQARLLERNYGRLASGVVPNFHPPASETLDKSGPMTVVWIANLKPWKQPDVLLRLAGRLQDIPQLRFLMVGAPPGAYLSDWYADLQRSAQAAGNVEILGGLAQEQVNELLARSHVFVNTSLHEGFPNTFIQAWLREAAVVSLHVNPDRILDREGIGIHAGSEDQLERAVRSLVTDPQQRAAVVERARRYALKRHSMQNALSLAQLIQTGKIALHADATFSQ